MEENTEEVLIQSKQEQSALEDFSLEKFLEKAFDETPNYKDSNAVKMSRLWGTVLALKPDFNPKNYGKKSAKDIVQAFPNIFYLYNDEKVPPEWFVEKRETAKLNLGRKDGVIKRAILSYRIIEAEDGDYFFYLGDINEKFKSEKIEKGTLVNFRVEKLPDPKASDSKNKNGRAIDVWVKK